MTDSLALGWDPRTAEEALQEELDWFFLVTGRDPRVLRCARRTLRRYMQECRYRPDSRACIPLALAVVGNCGTAVPVDFDESIPEGSWRAA